MSDETQVQVAQQTVQSEEPGESSVPEKQTELTADDEFKEQLFKFMDNQNKIIESLKKQNEESQKAITELTQKITDVKSSMTENVPTVLGKFDFDNTMADLSKEQSEQLYKENREIYDIIKGIWKY